MKSKKKVPPPRKNVQSHEELPRHSDWQNPRVVQILDAASRCFSRDGFSNTTVQEIAIEAGLTKSMIHYYFESKQVLILELQAFVHERYFRRVQQKLEALPPDSEQRLKEALWEVYDIVKDKQFMRLQLELWAEAGRDPNMRQRMMLAQQRSREFIQIGAEAVVNAGNDAPFPLPPSLSFMIASFLLGLRIQEFISGETDQARESYELFIALLTGAMQRGREQQRAGVQATHGAAS
jgi:AcrR family transcriptional regulator